MSVAVGALAASESKRLFRSPLAWIVLALGEGFMALFFMLLVVRYLENEAALRASGVTNAVLVPYFTAANLGMLLVAPLLTMNAIAGERRDGTLRFLYSTPLGALDIVGGKLGGVLGLTGAYVLLVVLMPATLFWGTPLDAGRSSRVPTCSLTASAMTIRSYSAWVAGRASRSIPSASATRSMASSNSARACAALRHRK